MTEEVQEAQPEVVQPEVVPETEVVPEAETEGKKAGKKSGKKAVADVVLFESAGTESHLYDVLVNGQYIRGAWDAKRERVQFSVPAEHVERFRLHYHVSTGRLIEKA